MSVFPTFEEIENGYAVFDIDTGRGRCDENGIWQPYQSRNLNLVICHNEYNEVINYIHIVRDKKREKRIGFEFALCGNKYGYFFPYSKEGWEGCVTKIKSILDYYKKIITKIQEEK